MKVRTIMILGENVALVTHSDTPFFEGDALSFCDVLKDGKCFCRIMPLKDGDIIE